jgi:hypothetical protein
MIQLPELFLEQRSGFRASTSTAACGAACTGRIRPRIAEIRDNLIARIAEAESEGWLGEVEGLKTSLAAAGDKLAQIDQRSRSQPADLGVPTIPALR